MAFNKVAEKESQIMTVEPIKSKQDIRNMVDWFYSKGYEKYAIIFWFGVSSGLRVSDILGLKVGDVYGKTRIMMREQKTGKLKEFPLNEKLQELLWDYARGRAEDEWLFEGRNHRRLDRSQVYKRLQEARDALKIDCHIGTHTMRKTFGYHSYRQYHDITLLQTIYNHTAPDVTKRYIGITQDEIDRYYLNFNLDPDANDFDNVKVTNSRKQATRMLSFCKSYLKNGGIKHKDFAQMVIEIGENDPFRDDEKLIG